MNIKLVAPLALFLLAACDGNPLGTGDPGGPDPEPIPGDVPAEVAVNLKAIGYNAEDETLTVQLESPGGTSSDITFTRTAALDVAGYDAYTYQQSGLMRSHLALVAENGRENLRAVAVSDGGQFNYRFGGSTFARIDTYTPTSGAFSYSGSYAGVFVAGDSANPALPTSMQPYTPYRVQGDILMTGDFTSSLVEGGIDNRVLLDDNGAVLIPLDAIVLKNTTINSDGRFLGDVEISGEPGSSIGDYAGLFGGNGATDVAGVLVINPITGEDGVWEFGVWNVARCGTAGAGPLCALD